MIPPAAISLADPWYLLAVLPVIALIYHMLRTTSTPLPTLRRALGAAGLGAAVSALLLCAAGIFWEVSSDQRTVWIVVDRSLSVGTSGEKLLPAVLQDLAASLPPDDYVGIILFDEKPTLALRPTPVRELRKEYELPAWEPSDESWIAPALELAAQQTVPGTSPFAVLISDGHDSSARYGGDLVREARDAGVRVFAMPVASQPMPETAVADFAARLVGGEQPVLAIDLVVFSTVPQLVSPQVKLNGVVVDDIECDKLDARGMLSVGVGRNPVRMLVRPRESLPAYVVEVSIAAEQNTFLRNDSMKVSVRGAGASRVLLLHGDAGPEEALVRALRRTGLQVTSGGPGLLPSEAIELSKFQVLVISDVPASSFSPGQHELIERFTRAGGGLAMIGGPRSFAPGGWYQTAVEKVLPVTCDVVEKGRRQVPALVVTLDRSGSMGAMVGRYSKMELANEGCARTIRLIAEDSYFGMLSVDTQPEWVVPFQPLKDKDAAAARALANQLGGGGIFVDIATRESIAALRGVEATTKHVVLFSDGSDTERQEGVLQLIEQANRRDGITFSAICLGEGDDRRFLEEYARIGGGRFFLVTDAADLPAVFSREAALSTGSFIREDEFRPWHGLPGNLTDGVNFESETNPPLLGYVATTAREQAHVWLWADEDKERPLLATWNIELGKALAFMSDARDRWADRWLPWESYDEMWQRWIRRLLPDAERIHGVESEWAINRVGPVLTLSFFDEAGNPRELDNPIAEVELADGSVMTAPTLPVGSGTYRVQFPRGGSGAYSARVRERPEGADEVLAAREHQVFVPLDELFERPADSAALQSLSAELGGSIINGAREILNTTPDGGTRTVWPYTELLWLAVAGLFLAIGARRFPSVWRRRVIEQRGRKQEEERVLSARAAYERVRKTLDDRSKAAAAPRSGGYFAPPLPPPPSQPAAQPTAEREPKSAPAGEDALLSAMRKVRKQLNDDHRSKP